MSKMQQLQDLAKSVELFYPGFGEHFMCPTCLSRAPLSSSSEVTKAHIIPQAAGGGLSTWLCKACNSKFGANQDKWFGEYVRLRHSKDPSIFDSKPAPHEFEINGLKVRGEIKEGADGGMEVYVYQNLISPKVREALEDMGKRPIPKGSYFQVEVPFLANRDMVDVGFLTAAYLLWFREFGYSWVLQAHLERVRQQIQSPKSIGLANSFVMDAENKVFEKPWIGIGYIEQRFVLLCGIADKLVLLPPAGDKDFYTYFAGGTLSKYSPIQVSESAKFVGPFGVLFGERMAIVPDILFDEPGRMKLLRYPEDGPGNAELMHAISKEQFELLATYPNVAKLKIDGPFVIPQKRTGNS